MEVVVVLPWVPATAMPWPPSMTAGQRRRPVQHPQPAPPGLDQLRVVRADRAGHHQRVGGLAQVLRRVPDRDPRAERGQLVAAAARRPSRCPTPATPPGQHDAGDAGHARAADADEVHPAQLADRYRVHRCHQPHGIPPVRPSWPARGPSPAPAPAVQVQHRLGQLAVGVPVAAVGRRLGHRRHQLRVEQDRQQRLLDPLRGQVGVGHDQPAAGLLDGHARSAAARRCRAAAARRPRAVPPR